MSGDVQVRFCEKLRVKFPWLTRLPLYRQSKIWDRVDIDLPRSTLCSWLMNVADLCGPLVKLSHGTLLKENYIQADESPVQVLKEPGRKDTSKSYLWVYRGGGNVIFDYQQTRGGYHAQTFLTGFKGYLQTDAYSGYYFRKNFLFMGSPQGAKSGAIFYSLIATCMENRVEPYQYFCTMLHQIRHCKREDDCRKLLPQFIQF